MKQHVVAIGLALLAGSTAMAQDNGTMADIECGSATNSVTRRKDAVDPALKKVADDTIRELIRTGEIERRYDKWFINAIPPTNTSIGLPLSAATRGAWTNPNDRPAEADTRR